MQTKGRKKNGKLGKFFVRNGTSRPDLSSLRKPIDTSVSDLSQVSGLLEDGTDELKSILSYECNVIYECRVCHSLFRSIVNLVSHKREYCKDKFDIMFRKRIFNNYNMDATKESIVQMFKTDQTNNEESVKNDRILRSQVSKESNKKDLSGIIDILNKKRKEYIEKQVKNENVISNTQSTDDQHIYLAIDKNCSTVLETIKSTDKVVDAIDLVKDQITELQNMTDENALVSDGQMSENQLSEKSDSPIQTSMSDEDEENELLIYRLPNNLSCSLCNIKLSTKKTLSVHMKTQHSSKRLCYPCPCCDNIFANTWSAYRHLSKVHRKSNEEIRKLKLHIQEKAFHRKTTAMKDIENVRAAEVPALENITENSNKTQEAISHIESNTNLRDRRRRRLGKKTSLSPYMQCYQTPIASCDEIIRNRHCNKLLASRFGDVQGKAEDVNLVANTIIKPAEATNIPSENSKYVTSPAICDHDSSIHIEAISTITKETWNKMENQDECNLVDSNNDSDVTSSQSINKCESLSSADQDNFMSENSKSSGVVCTKANEVSSAASEINKMEETSSQYNEKQLTDSKEGDKMEVEENNSKLQSSYSMSSNKNNGALLMESKIASLANFRKLRCLLCKRKFTSIPNLRRHIAMHIDWNRYRCKLCNFKCFVKSECSMHCNKVHNRQNLKNAIAEMILEIPQDEYTYNENVITDATGPSRKSRSKSNNPDVTDAATSLCQPETRVESSNGSNDLATHSTSQSKATATNEQVAESRESTDHRNVDADDSDKIVLDLSERMQSSKKLDDDPVLKQMIMEVIFGSTDVSAVKQADSNKPVLETSDSANVNRAVIIDEFQETFCPILENVKHQRPTRNRIKPLRKDFVYDLKEVAHRKENALNNNSETLHIRKKAKMYN